jgi:hypothetical protein
MIGDEGQYEELGRVYGEMSDAELVGLGQEMTDLTDIAQEVLKSEISRRGLSLTAKRVAKPVTRTDVDDRDESELWAFAAMAPATCVFEFEEDGAASAARAALSEEGVESVAVPERVTGFDLHGPRVVVAPEDAERAAMIVAQPGVESLINEAPTTIEEFHEPACPACGADESVLESVEPANRWRCDACGKEWVEDETLSKA